MKLYCSWTVTSLLSPGRVIRRQRHRRVHSFLHQWMQVMARNIGDINQTVIDMGGVPRTRAASGNNLDMSGAVTVDDYGLVVGSGSTPVDISDIALAGRIIHGNGAGQLQYGVAPGAAPFVSGQTSNIVLARSFTNASGAPVTIREIGSGSAEDTTVGALVIREVLPASVTLPDGQTFNLALTLSVTA